MALTRTTLAAAVGVDDIYITVASATGFAAGRLVRVDQEFMQIGQSYSSGVLIGPMLRGRQGTKTTAHVITAGVVVGTQADDWDNAGTGVPVGNIIAGRPRIIESITADNSTVGHTPAGSDHVVILNGTSVINLTIPIPTTDMDGDILIILGNGKAAHVVTITGGAGAVGATADVVTFGANQAQALSLIAANAVWNFLGPLATATANVSGPSVA
jgi:hypothetical protein